MTHTVKVAAGNIYSKCMAIALLKVGESRTFKGVWGVFIL